MSAPQNDPSVAWPLVVAATILAANWIDPVAAYLDYRWPVLGLGGALAIVMMLTAHGRAALDVDRLSRLNWLLLAAYLFHPFEVNGVDAFGRFGHRGGSDLGMPRTLRAHGVSGACIAIPGEGLAPTPTPILGFAIA